MELELALVDETLMDETLMGFASDSDWFYRRRGLTFRWDLDSLR